MTNTEQAILDAPACAPAIDGGVEGGITWAICPAPLYGAVNGYVRVPEDHPWWNLGYDEIDTEAPGGLTYADGGWIGFDTLHYGDSWPGMPYADPDARHWTPELVTYEARLLALRVALAALPIPEASR